MVADDQWPADDTRIGEKHATCEQRVDAAADWALLRPAFGAEQRRGVRLVQCSPVGERPAPASVVLLRGWEGCRQAAGRVALPPGVAEFLRRFDRGLYPRLGMSS